jgi:hypothetical protein
LERSRLNIRDKRLGVHRFGWILAAFAVFFVAFFSPVIFSGKLLASADALVESVPAYFGPRHLWEPLILLGYPMYADPNQMYWYPIAWLRFIPGTFNIFAMLPFWIAAVGTFAFVRRLTGSTFAGITSAIGFSLGGFMISHQGHFMIVHPAAWSPFVLWSIEEMRSDRRRRWMLLLAGSTAMCALGGQPQVLTFTLAIAASYAIVSSRGSILGAWPFLRRCSLATLLGLGVAAIGLVPQALLAHESVRQSLSFAQFVNFSVPLGELIPRFMFPYFAGLSGSFAELSDFTGVGILMLAILGWISPATDRRVYYWVALAVGGLALSTGDALGLAGIVYHIPVFNLLRIPGRHAFEVTLSLATLAGYGMAAVQRGAGAVRSAIAVLAVAGLLAVAFATVSSMQHVDAVRDVTLAAAFVCAVVASIVLLVWSLHPKSYILASLMLAAIVAELTFFGEQGYWRTNAYPAAAINPPQIAQTLRSDLSNSNDRALWAPGTNDSGGISPNLSLLWNIPVVTGYTPLVISRVSKLLGLGDDNTISSDGALDASGARLVVAPWEAQTTTKASAPFDATDLEAFLGSPRLAPASSIRLGTQFPVRADRIDIVSALSVSVDVPQEACVALLDITDVRGATVVRRILAGRDTSEEAYDRPDVRAHIMHRRATVFSSNAGGNRYVASFETGLQQPIDHISVNWVYPSVSAMRVLKIALVDSRSGNAYPMNALSVFYGDRSRFRLKPNAAGFALFENVRAFPRAWTVRDLLTPTTNDEEYSAIHSGLLADGHAFDAKTTAFIENANLAGHFAGGTVDAMSISDGNIRFTASCVQACFVITSDAWYPGWNATIDNAPAALVRTDGALRGLRVPAGRHSIEERFVPLDLLIGALVTGVTLVGIVCWTITRRPKDAQLYAPTDRTASTTASAGMSSESR